MVCALCGKSPFFSPSLIFEGLTKGILNSSSFKNEFLYSRWQNNSIPAAICVLLKVAVSVSTSMLGERGWSRCKVFGLRRCPSCWRLDLWRFRSGFFTERGGTLPETNIAPENGWLEY